MIRAKYEIQAMEAYRIWLSLFELYRYYSWIIDRFHILTQIGRQLTGGRYKFGWLESRLAASGFRLIICCRTRILLRSSQTASRSPVNHRSTNDLTIFIRDTDHRKAIKARLIGTGNRCHERFGRRQVGYIAGLLAATGALIRSNRRQSKTCAASGEQGPGISTLLSDACIVDACAMSSVMEGKACQTSGLPLRSLQKVLAFLPDILCSRYAHPVSHAAPLLSAFDVAYQCLR